jgi:LPXTG-motif cell wall-anchored protein
MKRVLLVISGAVGLVVTTAAVALAQYPPSKAPGGGKPPGGGEPGGGTLPFTGFNISWWVVVVLALALTGVILLFAGRRRRVQ